MAIRIFSPILAGATLRDRTVACIGSIIAIALTAGLAGLMAGTGFSTPLIVAPMGASAVLVFAVPASPLAQPWPVIGGNTISAAIGIAVALHVPDPLLATGLAVGLAIAAMSLTRSLHPPGGAAALTAVLVGLSGPHGGWLFPFVPVALNSILLVVLGIALNKLAGRNYPHVPAPPAPSHGTADPPTRERTGFRPEDIDAALAVLDETFDIDRADLERLLRGVEVEALVRRTGTLICRDIMSRDVVTVGPGTTASEARSLLLAYEIRTLPVVDEDRRLIGIVGLRELAQAEGPLGEVMSSAVTAEVDAPAFSLLPLLTDGRNHAVVIVDADRHIEGLITQTDLLAATARMVGR